MAELNNKAEFFRVITRRVTWAFRRALRNALARQHRLVSARITLLLVALGLSACLAVRCLALCDQAEADQVNSSLTLSPMVLSKADNALNSILLPVASIPEVLGRFDSIAQEFALRLERMDYSKELGAREKGDFLRINTTLIGNAEKMVAMSAELLRTYPGMSLVSLKLTRDRADSPDGEAQITWLLALKPVDSGEAAH